MINLPNNVGELSALGSMAVIVVSQTFDQYVSLTITKTEEEYKRKTRSNYNRKFIVKPQYYKLIK